MTPHFFKVFHIPVVRGRVFTERDDGAAPPVVVINEAMAKQYWKNQEALGQRLHHWFRHGPRLCPGAPARSSESSTDARDAGLNNDPQPATFVPLSQVLDSYMKLNNRFMPLSWVVRPPRRSFSLSSAIQRLVSEVAVCRGHTSARGSHRHPSPPPRDEFNAMVLGIFAFAAILLASIGLYGLMAYSVEQRTRVRNPAGARSQCLRSCEYGPSGRPAACAIGIVIGHGRRFWSHTPSCLACSFNVKPDDPAALRLGSRACWARWRSLPVTCPRAVCYASIRSWRSGISERANP